MPSHKQPNYTLIITVSAIAIFIFSIFAYVQLNIAEAPPNQYGTYQLLSDYQYDDNGGNGNLRIMQFYPNQNKIAVSTYSPYTNQWENDTDSKFTIPLDMNSDSKTMFTIIVLPDTQYYTRDNPNIFYSQTQWIADNKALLNIAHVIHLGDIVEDYTDPMQWNYARSALHTLTENNIPYSVLAGNHDGDFTNGNFVNYNTYFPATNTNHYGEGNENNYVLLTVSKVKLLLINLQYAPTGDQLNWANQVIADNPTYIPILSTHSYIADNSGTRNDEGNTIYEQFVQPNQIPLVLCGHNAREALKFE